MKFLEHFLTFFSLATNHNMFQVDDVPLEEIRSKSTLAEKLLSDGANWQEGIKVDLFYFIYKVFN